MSTKPRPAPCPTCPYRRDVPSGVWSEEEYDKLPLYDGDVPEQAEAGAFSAFLCHSSQRYVCAGWAGCHDMANNLAVRMAPVNDRDLDTAALVRYETAVPLFASGAEAAEHGKRDIQDPGPEAVRKVTQLLAARDRKRARTQGAG